MEQEQTNKRLLKTMLAGLILSTFITGFVAVSVSGAAKDINITTPGYAAQAK